MKRLLFALSVTLLAACNPLSNTLTLPPDPGMAANPSQTSSAQPSTSPSAPAAGVSAGESKTFLNQTVTSWAKVDGATINEAGFSLPLALIQATSTDVTSSPFSIKLDMPADIKAKTVIDHVSIDYIAGGHPPPGVYDVPHFDVHFYFNSQASQNAVDCSNKALPDAQRMAAPFMFLPPNVPAECVPAMGYHALDPRAPELAQQNPAKFDKTLIMGYYDGKLSFVEPMMSREFMLKKEGFSFDVLKPAVVDKAGLYPRKLEMRFNAETNAYDVVLKDFQ